MSSNVAHTQLCNIVRRTLAAEATLIAATRVARLYLLYPEEGKYVKTPLYAGSNLFKPGTEVDTVLTKTAYTLSTKRGIVLAQATMQQEIIGVLLLIPCLVHHTDAGDEPVLGSHFDIAALSCTIEPEQQVCFSQNGTTDIIEQISDDDQQQDFFRELFGPLWNVLYAVDDARNAPIPPDYAAIAEELSHMIGDFSFDGDHSRREKLMRGLMKDLGE